jgi:hypothetical protein
MRVPSDYSDLATVLAQNPQDKLRQNPPRNQKLQCRLTVPLTCSIKMNAENCSSRITYIRSQRPPRALGSLSDSLAVPNCPKKWPQLGTQGDSG